MPEIKEDPRIEADKKLAKALLGLRNNTDWEVVCDALLEGMVAADIASRTLDGAAMYRTQGKAIAFEALLTQSGRAEQTMVNAMASHSKRVRNLGNTRILP